MNQTNPYGDPTPAPQGPYGPPPGYPLQPPPVAPKSSGCGRMLLIALGAGTALILVLIAVGLAAGSGDDDTAGEEREAAGEESTGEGGGGAEVPEVFAVGETAHTGDFDVVVHGLQDPYTPTNQFEVPTAGYRFVAVEATITNTSDQPQSYSSLMNVELFDSADRPWDVALAGTDLPQLDAVAVAPGEARRGWVVFDVPPDSSGFQVRFKGNLTATGSVFQL